MAYVVYSHFTNTASASALQQRKGERMNIKTSHLNSLGSKLYFPSFLNPVTVRLCYIKPIRTAYSRTKCSCISTTATPPATVRIASDELFVGDSSVLCNIPHNVISTKSPPSPLDGGAGGLFLGASFSQSASRHIVSLGTLKNVQFLSCFRFKIWWMAQKTGNSGKEIPPETQFLLLESAPLLGGSSAADMVYTVVMPLLEGPFRACLQGNAKDELELCLESGDSAVTGSSFTHSVFIKAGTDPFGVITDAVRAVELHLKIFCHRDKKKMPGILDWFGWCTWDAFYQDVSAEGVERGLKSLSDGGTPPGFVIIDDGWQSVENPEKVTDKLVLGRLNHIKENNKFQIDVEEGKRPEDPAKGIQHIVQIAKEKYHLKYVYVWHAITGYWGGVKPGITEMDHYNSTLKYPASTPDSLAYMPEIDSLSVQGLGLMNPKSVFQFYDELHSYLAASGIDGVKVDVQNVLETFGSGFGGRVALTREYQRALDASIARNFPDNGCIACMSHGTDALYFSKQTAVVRASDDFYPRDPLSHVIHIASVSYNSIFLGEFMQPDWDMFHSLHPAAEYHAAARAIGGCPVYVSDKPGEHNFELLRKLVLPDGSILRARLPGRPTWDCLFVDPNRDGKSLLKIWNMNKYSGVLGVFNCQGAAWSQEDKINMRHDENPKRCSASIHPQNVHLLAEAAIGDWDGLCAVYSHKGGLMLLQKSAAFSVTLEVLEYEIYTITPIKNLATNVSFAPLGLIDMFNAGGAIKTLLYDTREEEAGLATPTVNIGVHGCGRFGAYSSKRPTKCLLGSSVAEFSFDSTLGLLTVMLPKPIESQLWNLTIQL